MIKKEIKEVCHVCGKQKEPYTVIMKNDMFSYLSYEQAREDGPICERCDRYFAMTGELKEPSDEEFENAKIAARFANNMRDWWEKDKKLEIEGDSFREWEGTALISRWLRDKLNKNLKGGK